MTIFLSLPKALYVDIYPKMFSVPTKLFKVKKRKKKQDEALKPKFQQLF